MAQSVITLNNKLKNPKILPTKYHLVIKPNLLPDEINGLFVPKSAQDRHQTTDGEIVEIGEDVPGSYQKGQTVLFSRYTGILIKIERELRDGDKIKYVEEPYQILHYEDIKGILVDEA